MIEIVSMAMLAPKWLSDQLHMKAQRYCHQMSTGVPRPRPPRGLNLYRLPNLWSF
jgi:hypothetical protein